VKEDTLSILLQTENDYHNAIKTAVSEAGKYVAGRRKEQAEYLDELKRSLRSYEETEGKKMSQALLAESDRMEEEAIKLKEKMKACQASMAKQIVQRLKEEVLSSYGNR